MRDAKHPFDVINAIEILTNGKGFFKIPEEADQIKKYFSFKIRPPCNRPRQTFFLHGLGELTVAHRSLNPAGRRRMTSCNVKMSTLLIDMPYWNVPFTLESSRER